MPTTEDWDRDTELGDRFVQKTLCFPDDYDGEVTATLVRNRQLVDHPKGAVLYLHGFIDYFFQSHLADAFNSAQYDFYALDLRKYGRSLRCAFHPNFCKDFEEYFPEITAAIEIITAERHASVVLNAHSTGALAGALYAKFGRHQQHITRLVLNSPFLELPQGPFAARLGALLGGWCTFCRIHDPVNPWYARSLHVDCKGEWRFNKALKPLQGFAAYYGWIRAVVRVQNRIKKQLELEQPVLVLHSDQSAKGDEWSDEFHRADLVLEVEHIRRLAPNLGKRTEIVEIPGGKHDLALSCEEPREHYLRVVRDWIARPAVETALPR